MKIIINDQKHAALRIVEDRDSLPANHNSKIRNQKSPPLSLTPCFSKVWHSLTASQRARPIASLCRRSAFKYLFATHLFALSLLPSAISPTAIFARKTPEISLYFTF
jgi:hypothetical protein